MEQSIFSWGGHHVKVFQSQDSGKDLKIHAETLLCHILDLLKISNQSGSFLKMSLVCSQVTEEKILEVSLGGWGNWGMGSPTEFLTLNGAEHTGTQEPCRNAEGVCSLSDVLEITSVPQRFYLSEKACQGILRRAERRGKELPSMLRQALLLAGGMEKTQPAH